MVRPEREPDEIVMEHFNFADRDTFIKLFSQYQKTRPDWDTYRNKIPDILLQKWAKILRECRKNGFVQPKLESEKIVWSQILGFKRNYKNADKCTLCGRSQRAGDCMGRPVFKNQQRMFRACWEA